MTAAIVKDQMQNGVAWPVMWDQEGTGWGQRGVGAMPKEPSRAFERVDPASIRTHLRRMLPFECPRANDSNACPVQILSKL